MSINKETKVQTEQRQYKEGVQVPPPPINADIAMEITHINGMKVTEEWFGLYIHGEDGMRTCKTCGFFWDGFAQHFCIDDRS